MDEVETIVAAVLAGASYRDVAPDLARRLAGRAVRSGVRGKEAVKAVKNDLHQAVGAYVIGRPSYAQWIERLTAVAGNPTAFRSECGAVMERHASTRERLPYLDSFYGSLFEALPPVGSVIDVACGLNPLSIPRMPLARGATYIACDAFVDLAGFLGSFLPLTGVVGRADARDVVMNAPTAAVDLALVLKLLPPLELHEKGAGIRLLERLNARHIAVSFPRRTLGGRNKGMAAQYERSFLDRLPEGRTVIARVEIPTEICFVLE